MLTEVGTHIYMQRRASSLESTRSTEMNQMIIANRHLQTYKAPALQYNTISFRGVHPPSQWCILRIPPFLSVLYGLALRFQNIFFHDDSGIMIIFYNVI